MSVGFENGRPKRIPEVDPSMPKANRWTLIYDNQFGDKEQSDLERMNPFNLGAFSIDIRGPVKIEYITKPGNVGSKKSSFSWETEMYFDNNSGETVVGLKEDREFPSKWKISSSGTCCIK